MRRFLGEVGKYNGVNDPSFHLSSGTTVVCVQPPVSHECRSFF